MPPPANISYQLSSPTDSPCFLHEFFHALLKSVEVARLTFPHGQRSPSVGPEARFHDLVSANIPSQLRHPILAIGCGHPRTVAAVVNMPKATMYKDHLAVLRKHHV